ncbi:hypothetical protein INS49_009989 [Diaporthe citri]|uniref:uncharacterized protein n=1 Tax=Diaporthe citri TaxID=83186 RepID=UPI001C81C9CD|nr:uncharacterized protein INS49_009989 [Diaporthe citri]KAG6361761.1 hypothetical protein INS49_009989 [Diaporthe citri]
MASEYDSEIDEAANHGSIPFWKRCLLCGTDLELDWPYLPEINPSDIKNHAHGEWRRGAELGCSFCNIVVSVVDDARKQHGCSISDGYGRILSALPDRKYTLKGFQVFLGLNESTDRYLLALEFVWMPLLVDPEEQNEFWGTITIYLDGPDIFNTQLEPFFEIPRHSGSAEALDNARHWLTACQNDHPDCSGDLKKDQHILEPPSDSWIRILEICEEKLRLTSVKLGEALPPYVALSYCWGSCPTLKTLSTNIERFWVGIEHRDLPSTFVDAIKVTKLLGFDHIWIDSLCIIQDNATDWEEQSSLMAFVYGNADLVLAASGASSTEDGFLKERKCYRETSLRLACVQNKDSSLNLRYRLLQPKDMEPMLDPLDRRAWALQERLLARRYLAIGSHDTSWTCMTSSACECEWWRVASIWRNEIINIKKLIQDMTAEDLGVFWRGRVLRHYLGRDLTVPSDNLVALSAIASIFQKKSRSKYCAGIWQDDLILGLLWICPSGRIGYASDNSAPSWSWASLPFSCVSGNIITCADSQIEAQVRVLDVNTVVPTLNQFGSVCSGFVKLSGRLWTAEVTARELASESAIKYPTLRVKGYLENDFALYFDTSLIVVEMCPLDTDEGSSLRRVRREELEDSFYIRSVQESEKINLFMVPLLKGVFMSQIRDTHGLILGRSPKDPTKFERVGVFSTSHLTAVDPCQHHGSSLDDCDGQELVII